MPYGYTVISQCNVITIIARDGIGEDMNGTTASTARLFVQLSAVQDFLLTENNDIIDTENNNNIIIEY